MKTLLALGLAFATTLSSVAKSDESSTLVTSLRDIEVDGDWDNTGENIELYGNVYVDTEENTMLINIAGGYKCKPMQPCPRAFFRILDQEFSDIKTHTYSDGTVVYSVREDARPVDGGLTTLRVRDFSNSTNPALRTIGTSVVLKSKFLSRGAGGTIKKSLHAKGSKLSPLRTDKIEKEAKIQPFDL
ncbi:MAG: hypothetical protein KDD25_06140 [Bdellovibrionales bacterium]|nr:hypothetical protein [Bdellovibrionales bacterium]